MKKILIAIAAALVIAALGVPTALAATGQRPAAATPSIVQQAVALNASGPYAGSFDTLICLVSNNPAVLDTLSQKGQYTVFAPTDAAFSAIGITSSNCAGAASAVTGVLLFHVAHGRRDAAAVISSTRIRMLNKQFTTISSSSGTYYVNNAQILATDVFASNGVIHAIDTVLLPS